MINEHERFEFLAKSNYEMVYSWHKKLYLCLVGKRHYQVSFPYEIIAYEYKNKLYITKYGRIA
jgi:hypothetical protein